MSGYYKTTEMTYTKYASNITDCHKTNEFKEALMT